MPGQIHGTAVQEVIARALGVIVPVSVVKYNGCHHCYYIPAPVPGCPGNEMEFAPESPARFARAAEASMAFAAGFGPAGYVRPDSGLSVGARTMCGLARLNAEVDNSPSDGC